MKDDSRTRLGRRRFLAAAGAGALLAAPSAATPEARSAAPGSGLAAPGDGSAVGSLQATDQHWPMAGYDLANTYHSPTALGPTGNVSAAWEFDVSVDHENGQEYKDGKLEGSAPAVVDGTVYFGDSNRGIEQDYLHAVDAADGRQQWRFAARGVRTSPAVDDGTVYFGDSNGDLVAVDAASGDEQWRFSTEERLTSAPKVADGTVYFGGRDGTFYALEASSGVVSWTYDYHRDNGNVGVWTEPAVADGTVFATTRGRGTLYVYAFDAASGDVVWKNGLVDVGTSHTPLTAPAAANGMVYLGDPEQDVLRALDAATGEYVWRSQNLDFHREAGPAVAGCTVFVGTAGGNLVAVNAATGEKLWRAGLGGAVRVSPAVANGVVYVGDDGGQFHAIDAASGDRLWATRLGGSVLASPVVSDGAVYASGGSVLAKLTGDVADRRGGVDYGVCEDGQRLPDEGAGGSDGPSGDDASGDGTDGDGQSNGSGPGDGSGDDSDGAAVDRGFFTNGGESPLDFVDETTLTLVGIVFSIGGILFEMLGGR